MGLLGETLKAGKNREDKEIYFFAPTIKRYQTKEWENSRYPFFVPVSITGSFCQLNCEHCRGRILEAMYYTDGPDDLLELGQNLFRKGCRGLLISGGSNSRGVVPLLKYVSSMKKLKKDLNFKIVVHTGLVDEPLARGLREAMIDAAMIDIIGANETIKAICHLKATIEDYENSLQWLGKYEVPVSPHVVIGLHYGRIVGEMKALEIISRHKIASLVLVVLSSLADTPMENVKGPSLNEVGKIFVRARQMFPEIPILLGCARPKGKEKLKIEIQALEAQLDGIAYPSEEIFGYAKGSGLKPRFSEYCCSLIFDGEAIGNEHPVFDCPTQERLEQERKDSQDKGGV
ncbi:MAG: radical SAM protein [bacterium]